MLLKDAILEFERGLIGQGFSSNSVTTYMRHLRRLANMLGEKNIGEIRYADLTNFLFSVRLKEDGSLKSTSTLNSIKTAVRSLFRSLDLDRNPAARIVLKQVRLELDYLTELEIRTLMSGTCTERDHLILAA